MSSSPTEVCNLALSWLAGGRILSLDDEGQAAQLCKSNYDLSRKAVLEEREWTFAVKRLQLPALAEEPLVYSAAFLVPPDLLYSIAVTDPGSHGTRKPNPPQIVHSFEGDRIYAYLDLINIKYIFDLTNTQKFSGLFDQTLAAHIAMNIAIPLTENKEHFVNMANLYNINLDRAAASDGMQGTREKLDISQMEQSRRMFVTPE